MSDVEKCHGKPWEEWRPGWKAVAICGGALAGLGLMALCGFVFMWLWNGLMPRLFKLPAIGYWEGWGLLVLSSLLFKSLPGGGRGRPDRRKRTRRGESRKLEGEERPE